MRRRRRRGSGREPPCCGCGLRSARPHAVRHLVDAEVLEVAQRQHRPDRPAPVSPATSSTRAEDHWLLRFGRCSPRPEGRRTGSPRCCAFRHWTRSSAQWASPHRSQAGTMICRGPRDREPLELLRRPGPGVPSTFSSLGWRHPYGTRSHDPSVTPLAAGGGTCAACLHRAAKSSSRTRSVSVSRIRDTETCGDPVSTWIAKPSVRADRCSANRPRRRRGTRLARSRARRSGRRRSAIGRRSRCAPAGARVGPSPRPRTAPTRSTRP